MLKKSFKRQIVKVKYIDHRTKEVEVFERFCKMHPSEILHYKNIGYEYEAEVRVIFDGVKLIDTEPAMIIETYTTGINPQGFATEIIVAPFADDWFYDLVQHEMEEFDMAALVQWSSLKFKPSDCTTAQPNADYKRRIQAREWAVGSGDILATPELLGGVIQVKDKA
ncbi:MAG: hypothetical protein JZU65_09140 [Chlorobium sp.]|nr:hypothetical protein [Chlorobium sp.]